MALQQVNWQLLHDLEACKLAWLERQLSATPRWYEGLGLLHCSDSTGSSLMSLFTTSVTFNVPDLANSDLSRLLHHIRLVTREFMQELTRNWPDPGFLGSNQHPHIPLKAVHGLFAETWRGFTASTAASTAAVAAAATNLSCHLYRQTLA